LRARPELVDGSPLILIVGDDVVAEGVCSELVAANEPVRVLFHLSPAAAERFRRTGAAVTIGDPNQNDTLHEAGVAEASAILTLSDNDELNLAVALRARVLNPRIRVILRQFSPKIGRKIEQSLRDATVMSLAVHAAATYAGAALDPGCFFALQFPESDGALVGFTRATAAELGIAGITVAAAEDRMLSRILAIDDEADPPPEAVIRPHDRLVVFGEILERRSGAAREKTATPREPYPLRRLIERGWKQIVAINPIARTVILGSVVFFSFALLFFHLALHATWDSAAIDVAETMSNAGFGDTSAARHGSLTTAGAIALMIGGTIFTSIFIGFVSAAITRAQWVNLQGLRRVRARDHILVCGGGRTGGAVVALLTAAGKRVVVIESHPDPGLVRRARYGDIDLMTGDATHEDVLELCNIPHASAVVALTNNDTGNLEIALGARALRPDVPLVVRMESRTFSQATTELFNIATFSPAELSAPALAGLARFPGTLGRVRYGGIDHTLVQRTLRSDGEAADMAGAEPLAVWRKQGLIIARYTGGLRAGDVVLYAVRRTPATRPATESPALGLSV
jgi:Trk K+ transport system NAD-binding subunit